MKPLTQKFLVMYSAVVSTALLCVVLIGAAKPRISEFDEIKVHRINVTEPDGTLRMVIANKDRLPKVIIKGQEQPSRGDERVQAGMLFYNNEGTENGGLIFGGHKNEKGEVIDSGGSLSFDKYDSPGQLIQFAGVDDKDNQFAGLSVTREGQRVWIGRDGSGVASVSLTDAQGKKRIQMQVNADGTPSLAFLDADGHVVQELAPKK